jgi:hypothetical protein
MKHIRLPGYDASDLDRLSYSSGDIVSDLTNKTVRYMDGVTPGGFQLATETYVQTNAITSANLATNLSTALAPYALTSSLSVYATTTALNSAIAAIPIYSLPAATTSSLGGVKVDGTSITINPTTGVISGSNQYTLPIATTGVIGGVSPDGTTITINPSTGVISGANTYVLPTATTTVKGGVIVPAVATSGINNSSGTISLAQASTTQLGGVKVDGSTITINATTGVISGANTYVLPAATTTTLGGVIVPAVANSGLTNTSGTIRLATATTNQLGGVKVDGVTITINGSGVIAANITGAIVFQGGWDASTNTPTLNNTSSSYNTNGFEFVTTKSGTVNFGLGNVTFAVGDNVIYDGTKWVKIPIGSSAGTTNNAITFDNAGAGAASGSTFNGSTVLDVSYNTIGASPLAGSSSITTVGTIASGTWNGSVIGASYGGTGVANSFTLTVSGANRTIDQNVNVNSAPIFVGTNFSGTAASLTAGNATLAASATTAGSATNIAGGVANQLHVQTGVGATGFVATPTDSTYLKYTTAGGLQWTSVATATAATNLAGGAANQLHYQTAANTSSFVTAPVTTGTYLQWNGTSFVWAAVSGATGGTVTSVSGTGTVSGISLSGTVTASGSLTLGGTLSLVSPPAIGGTTPNTGAFTILTVNSASTSAVTLSPTGSGTVTINPTTTGTINNMSVGATTASTGKFTTITATSQALTSDGGGTIYLSNTTNARIDFAAGGFAPPAFTTRSTGAKVVLYPSVTSSSADYAIGIDSNTLWNGVPTSSQQFLWYAGTTGIMTLSGAGALSATSFAGAVNGTVGATTPNTGAFTTLSASTSVSFSPSGAITLNPTTAGTINNMSIGATTASTGAFTTLSASSTVSGAGFSTYLASPPAIGGTAAAAITGTTVKATTSIGYATGASAGGAVTQLVSRTSSVTLNKITGQITLFLAAGNTGAYTSFTVSNSTVAATDTIDFQCSSSTNTYIAFVTAIAAGSFTVNFLSINGTASDSPVFNFNVIKGSAN